MDITFRIEKGKNDILNHQTCFEQIKASHLAAPGWQMNNSLSDE